MVKFSDNYTQCSCVDGEEEGGRGGLKGKEKGVAIRLKVEGCRREVQKQKFSSKSN